MAFYEHVFIARQDVTPPQIEVLTEHLKTLIGENGGKVVASEYWGLRPLSFRIKKNRKGHYVLMNVEAPSAAVNEIERQHKINEDIIRYLTVRVDELEEGPSAMMRVRDREERRRAEFGRSDDEGIQ